MESNINQIEALIYTIRGKRVMLDSELANLYGVETKRLNEQVKRNLTRFPADFMFQITKEEFIDLKSHFATSKSGSGGKQKLPFVFTENGVAMLSGVLHSDRAIEVNISIMRTFTKLRSFLVMDCDRIDKLETGTNQLFRIVFERLDSIEEIVYPKISPLRKKIGLKTK